ncbi:DUF429 domain-containing protein [Jatrophihabitans sp. DSM 45814]
MITVGIDLAAEPTKTAGAVIEWSTEHATVHSVEVFADNRRLLELIKLADKVGIDCPLGWPSAFVDFIVAHRDRRVAPGSAAGIADRDALAFRVTDRRVREDHLGLPLSVSTDRIGRAAMRLAGLLAKIEEDSGEPIDRAGRGRIVEVYPAAALRAWNFRPGAYKRDAEVRLTLVRALADRTKEWLTYPAALQELSAQSDDALDAIIAGLNARAATISGATFEPVTPEEIDAAEIEGWIAVPTGPLEDLRPR